MPRLLGPLERSDFAGVLFDLDGTLIDSGRVVEQSWAQWAVELGVEALPVTGLHGMPARAVVERLLPAAQVDAAVDRIEAIEVATTDGIVLLPGAREALAALTGEVDHCAIATSCTAPLASARIAAASLHAPRVVVTASDVARGKPHPDPYLLAARRLGVDPHDCLVVEDAPGGLQAARAAGCSTLALTTTTSAGELHADAVVGTLGDVRFELRDGRVRVTSVATPT